MPLAGESTVENMRHLEYEIEGLAKGNKYYVRVSAWNMKGYSPFTTAKPSYAVPSSKSVILIVILCKHFFYEFTQEVCSSLKLKKKGN